MKAYHDDDGHDGSLNLKLIEYMDIGSQVVKERKDREN